MSAAWRIDSLDLRAGSAVVSFREPDLDGEEPPRDTDAVFLTAPFFAPEAVGSRMIGFAAARAGAQLGLFLDGREPGFETLEALREFVRRLYVGGGGGDEPGAPAPPVEPSPEPSSDPEAPRTREPESAVLDVLQAAKTAASLVSTLAYDPASIETVAFDGVRLRTPRDPEEATRVFAAGAVEIIESLLMSAPVDGDPERLRPWMRAARALAGAVWELGLWDAIESEGHRPRLGRAYRYVLEGADEGALDYAAHLMGTIGPPFRYLERRARDPVDDVASWPIGPRAAAAAQLEPRRATAADLISSLSASPQKLVTGDYVEVQSAVAVLLFSAAHIVAASELWDVHSLFDDDLQSEALMEATIDWISGQWPQLLFPEPVENLIRSAGHPQVDAGDRGLQA